MKSFNSAASRRQLDPELDPDKVLPGPAHIEFEVDGEVWKARKPKPGQLVMLSRTPMPEDGSVTEGMVAASLDFLDAILDGPSRERAHRKLMDGDDEFDWPQAMEIVTWLSEHWIGRPNGNVRGSAKSLPRKTTSGRSSTGSARSAASTRGRSTRTASST